MRTVPTLTQISGVTMRGSGVDYTQSSATNTASYRCETGGLVILNNFSGNPTGVMYYSTNNAYVFAFDAEIY